MLRGAGLGPDRYLHDDGVSVTSRAFEDLAGPGLNFTGGQFELDFVEGDPDWKIERDAMQLNKASHPLTTFSTDVDWNKNAGYSGFIRNNSVRFPVGSTHVYGVVLGKRNAGFGGTGWLVQNYLTGDLYTGVAVDAAGPNFSMLHSTQNGGQGSGFDSDLLDGQSGGYYMDNTDSQGLSLSGTILNIENGNGVDLSSFANQPELDSIYLTSRAFAVSGGIINSQVNE